MVSPCRMRHFSRSSAQMGSGLFFECMGVLWRAVLEEDIEFIGLNAGIQSEYVPPGNSVCRCLILNIDARWRWMGLCRLRRFRLKWKRAIKTLLRDHGGQCFARIRARADQCARMRQVSERGFQTLQLGGHAAQRVMGIHLSGDRAVLMAKAARKIANAETEVRGCSAANGAISASRW